MSYTEASVSATQGTSLRIWVTTDDGEPIIEENRPARLFVTFRNPSGRPDDMTDGSPENSVDLRADLDGMGLGTGFALMLPPAIALELADQIRIVATGKGGYPTPSF